VAVKPKVSILIPTYNRAHLLRRAIRSCLAQTQQGISVIVLDDGSTDKTEIVVRRFKDERIQYHRYKHAGVASARNKLIGLCKTGIACWLDSDDVCNKHRVEMQLAAMTKLDLPFITTGKLKLSKVTSNAWTKTPLPTWDRIVGPHTAMFRVECSVPFDEGMAFKEDTTWQANMVLKHGDGAWLPLALYHPDSRPNDRITKLQSRKGFAATKPIPAKFVTSGFSMVPPTVPTDLVWELLKLW
jgi:glycosyltransferase involved in cell wall biosynthesis